MASNQADISKKETELGEVLDYFGFLRPKTKKEEEKEGEEAITSSSSNLQVNVPSPNAETNSGSGIAQLGIDLRAAAAEGNLNEEEVWNVEGLEATEMDQPSVATRAPREVNNLLAEDMNDDGDECILNTPRVNAANTSIPHPETSVSHAEVPVYNESSLSDFETNEDMINIDTSEAAESNAVYEGMAADVAEGMRTADEMGTDENANGYEDGINSDLERSTTLEIDETDTSTSSEIDGLLGSDFSDDDGAEQETSDQVPGFVSAWHRYRRFVRSTRVRRVAQNVNKEDENDIDNFPPYGPDPPNGPTFAQKLKELLLPPSRDLVSPPKLHGIRSARRNPTRRLETAAINVNVRREHALQEARAHVHHNHDLQAYHLLENQALRILSDILEHVM